MNFCGGFPHISARDKLLNSEGKALRPNMESHKTFQAYLQLKFCPRGGRVFEPFAGTCSGYDPTLHLIKGAF
jgi:hypothetical protein